MSQNRQSLPGNVTVKRRRVRRETIALHSRRNFRVRPRPWMIPLVFAITIGLGTVLLSLPIASESHEWTHGIDALFTATSAVSVTGLVRFDTAEHWSIFGEITIIVLIQAGGLGITIYAGVLLMLFGNRFGLRDREFFGMELLDFSERDIYRLLRRIILFTFVIEFVTFLLLLPWYLNSNSVGAAIWKSIFHSISALNNAGFDLQGERLSFIGEVNNPYPIAVMGMAAFLGSLSFVTVFNMTRPRRSWSLDTKLVGLGMLSLLLVGMMVFLTLETSDGRVLDSQNVLNTLVNSLFLSINRTTGMSTIDFALIEASTATILMLLMVIGGASTSTASGIKIGTFMVTLVVMFSAIRGRHRSSVFGRDLPQAIIVRAVAVTGFGLLTIGTGVFLIGLTEQVNFLALLFEVTSAAANVGWSQGITVDLSHRSTIVLVGLMFLGRLGPLYIALSIPDKPRTRYRFPEAGVRIG